MAVGEAGACAKPVTLLQPTDPSLQSFPGLKRMSALSCLRRMSALSCIFKSPKFETLLYSLSDRQGY